MDGTGAVRVAHLNLVDLAGSERADTSKGASKEVLKEGIQVNMSLSALNKCINALSADGLKHEKQKRKAAHIPFRDSKLTMILRVSSSFARVFGDQINHRF